MKAQKITREVIENLPDEIYAIFKNDILVDILQILENNRFLFRSEYWNILNYNFEILRIIDNYNLNLEDCYIILASEVKLNQTYYDIGKCAKYSNGVCADYLTDECKDSGYLCKKKLI